MAETTVKGGVVSEALAQRGRPGTADALMDAVDGLLAERGWTACSLQAVARRAGLTTGAIYSTFGSRGALLAAAMVRRAGDHARLDEAELDLTRAVTQYARGFWAAIQSPEGVNLVVAQLDLLRQAAVDEEIAHALAEQHSGLIMRLAADIAARSPELAPRSSELAHRFVAVLQGLTLQHIAFGSQLGPQAFIDGALSTLGL